MDNDTSDVFLCPRCGEKLKVGTKFCHNCGLKIKENEDNEEKKDNCEDYVKIDNNKNTVINTIVCRNLCKVTSIFLFIEVIAIIGGFLEYINPSLLPSGDSPFRLVILAVGFAITGAFYSHTVISKDSEEYKNGEDKGWFLYKGEKDYKILGPLIFAWAIFIITFIILIIFS